MPNLNWIGKEAVARLHARGPFRLVHCRDGLSAGGREAGNLLVHGDNLEALRSLLPYYGGTVKCVYIDPPYNTGTPAAPREGAGWVYSDRVDSPQMARWLDEAVGDEEDLSRHDKWLCMMYPRLRLLRDFLREDGVIFVSIDDHEVHRLRFLMDEIFGETNFVNTIIWQRASGGGNAKGVVTGHDYVLVYQKNKAGGRLDFRGEEKGGRFSQDKTVWRDGRKFYIEDDCVRKVFGPYPPGVERRCHYEELALYRGAKQVAEIHAKIGRGEYVLLPQKDGRHFIGRYVEEGARKRLYSIRGVLNNQGRAEMAALGLAFPYPKPVRLVQELIHSCCGPEDVVMDSFAGSGTTAHAVLRQNALDGGNRRFVLIEMEKRIAEDIAAVRLRKVIGEGYAVVGGGGGREPPTGGGFRFCVLGKALFDGCGRIAEEVRFCDLAAHVFFADAGVPLRRRAESSLLGVCEGRAVYLLFEGVGDAGNVLTGRTLASLPAHPAGVGAPRVVYGEGVRLSEERLRRENVVFRQVPWVGGGV